MGFRGYVVSDSDAVEYLYSKHKTAKDMKEAVRQSVEAGPAVHQTEHQRKPLSAVPGGGGGVMGDERTYDYAVALRAVTTVDFMTAEAAEIPYDVLNKVMSRIINEVKGVNRVFYDLTSKPPGTIEFE